MAEGRSNTAIAEQMVVTEPSKARDVDLREARLPPAPQDHRRVLAVLTFLRA